MLLFNNRSKMNETFKVYCRLRVGDQESSPNLEIGSTLLSGFEITRICVGRKRIILVVLPNFNFRSWNLPKPV